MTIRIAALAVTIAALAGCAGSSVSQVATDASLIAAALPPLLASLSAIPGVNQTTIATLQADNATVQADAALLAKTPSATTAAGIESTIAEFAPLALTLVPGASPYVPVIEAAVSLAQVLVTDFSAPSTTAASAVAPTVYTASQARAILAAGVH